MVCANQLKKNLYIKTSKKARNEIDKNTLLKEIKKELRKGKIIIVKFQKNNVNRKSINGFDENISKLKDTSTKNNLALISLIENTKNTNLKQILAKEIFILGMKMKLN